MEIKLYMPDGKVITSNSERKAASKLPRSQNIEQIKEAAREVRELISRSNELDRLEKNLDEVGYAEWVNNGNKDRFYMILNELSSGAETARAYWEERNHSAHNSRQNRLKSPNGRIRKSESDGPEF